MENQFNKNWLNQMENQFNQHTDALEECFGALKHFLTM